MLALLVIPSGASAAPLEQRLERSLGPGINVELSDDTGKVSFIGTTPSAEIEGPAGTAPAAVARDFVSSHAGAFGVSGSPADLLVTETVSAPQGVTAVRLQQEHEGVPVVGGLFVVNVDAGGDVISVSGEAAPVGDLSTEAEISATEALDTALGVTAKTYDTTVSRLQGSAPVLSVFDSRLLGGPGPDRRSLVWQIEVTEKDAVTDIREFVLVDAKNGGVPLHFSQIAHAKNRIVCDAFNTAAHVPCTTPVRTETSAPTATADVENAFEFAGDTYDFFAQRFARDSLDGAGMQLKSTVRYCDPTEPCPFQNAFWNGDQMVYGEGYASADDVVGHEFGHGLDQFTSNLFYYYQSGAIDESLTDVWGEFVDLVQNPTPADTAANKWLMGEDLPIGEIRDMENPENFGDPDRMLSPNYHGDPSDSGGVHSNSGVNNKAAFLITDGGTFNGRTVTGLGIEKAARIYYAVETTMLVSGSDYADLGNGLQQACINLIGTAGITAANCTEVSDAVAATQMLNDPPAAPAPDAPVCNPGLTPGYAFFDSLESGSGWNPTGTPNVWMYDSGYASHGTRMLYGDDSLSNSDGSIESPPISLPSSVPSGGLFLRFAHAYDFEEDFFASYDGGVVEYSTNNGSSWADVSLLGYTHNGYTGTITTGTGNPLAGRSAYTGVSNGYRSARVNLASIAGQTVRFRFRLGTDDLARVLGWVVDDVRVYGCAQDTTPPETTITSGPAEGSTISGNSTSFGFSSTEAGTFLCQIDGGGFTPCASGFGTGPLANGNHTFQVRAVDLVGNQDPTPATRSFNVSVAGPGPDLGPLPNVRFLRAAINNRKRKATFRFRAAGGVLPLTYQCKIDRKPWRSCRSPKTYRKLKRGRHVFRVRARDAAGRVDPTPSVKRFRIK